MSLLRSYGAYVTKLEDPSKWAGFEGYSIWQDFTTYPATLISRMG